MTPEVVDNLRELVDVYAEADKWFLKNNKGGPDPSEWNNVKNSSEYLNPGYIHLKEAISDWARKFNLLGEVEFYQSHGLTSLYFFYTDCKEEERKTRLQEYMNFADQLNVPLEALRTSKEFRNSWPYEEKLVLADNLFNDDELDNIELSKSYYQSSKHHQSFFNKVFPFAFTPGGILQNYEGMKDFFELVIRNVHNLSAENTFMKEPPLYSGKAWDPRSETWEEFEMFINSAFKEYKKFYRERSELFLKERGYVKEAGKRNNDHFKWLLHYQVQKWTARKIADYYSHINETISEDTVYKGLKSAAQLVFIETREKVK